METTTSTARYLPICIKKRCCLSKIWAALTCEATKADRFSGYSWHSPLSNHRLFLLYLCPHLCICSCSTFMEAEAIPASHSSISSLRKKHESLQTNGIMQLGNSFRFGRVICMPNAHRFEWRSFVYRNCDMICVVLLRYLALILRRSCWRFNHSHAILQVSIRNAANVVQRYTATTLYASVPPSGFALKMPSPTDPQKKDFLEPHEHWSKPWLIFSTDHHKKSL